MCHSSVVSSTFIFRKNAHSWTFPSCNWAENIALRKVSLNSKVEKMQTISNTFLKNFLDFIAVDLGRHFVFPDIYFCAKVSVLWNGCGIEKLNFIGWSSVSSRDHLPRQLSFWKDFRIPRKITKWKLHRRRVSINIFRLSCVVYCFFSLSAYQALDLLYDQNFLPLNFSTEKLVKTLEKFSQHNKFESNNYFFWNGVFGVPLSRILTRWGFCLNFNMYNFNSLLDNKT